MLNKLFNTLYIIFLKNLFSLKGRASRKEYIIRFVLMPAFIVLANLIIKYDDNSSSVVSSCAVIMICLISAVYILQVFFATHRRLHDLNASGWWQLITFLPCGQLLMIGFIFCRGTPGPNRYGEPPAQ